jgi:hypothetical protein
MTKIQRYVVGEDQLASRRNVGEREYAGTVDVVTEADHLAAVAAAGQMLTWFLLAEPINLANARAEGIKAARDGWDAIPKGTVGDLLAIPMRVDAMFDALEKP